MLTAITADTRMMVLMNPSQVTVLSSPFMKNEVCMPKRSKGGLHMPSVRAPFSWAGSNGV